MTKQTMRLTAAARELEGKPRMFPKKPLTVWGFAVYAFASCLQTYRGLHIQYAVYCIKCHLMGTFPVC